MLQQVSALINQAQALAATQVNVTLTLRNWYIGRLIDLEVLKEQRAGYDKEIVATLSPQLTKRFGRGFNRSSLYRMVKFSQTFPDIKIVATLSPKLSWSHFREIVSLPHPGLSTREKPLHETSAYATYAVP